MVTDTADADRSRPGGSATAESAAAKPLHHGARVSGARLNSLTGMRALAMAPVFLFHMTSPGISPLTGQANTTLQNWTLWLGTAAVSFFFILSGFVLTWSLRPDRTPGYFIRRRLARIFPNHLVTFALAMAFFAAATTPASVWVRNLLLVQTWVPELRAIWSVNQPSWSLACELFCYLCYPLLYAGVRRIRPDRLWLCVAVVAVLVIAIPEIAYAALPGANKLTLFGIPASVQQYWFVYAFPPVRMLEFVLGVLMARIVLTGQWVKIRHGWVFLLFLAGYALTFRVPYLYRFDAATVIPLALLIPAAAVDEEDGRRSFLRARWLVKAGDVSFAFYLMQGVVLVAAGGLLAGHRPWSVWQGLGVLAAYCLTTGAAAWLLHVCVEKPTFKYLTAFRRPVPRPVEARER